jgi:hypothetical protein
MKQVREFWLALRRNLRANRAGWVLGGCACAGFALTLHEFAPGYMSWDSLDQLQQARSLKLVDRHPILLALMWHWLDSIAPGPLGVLIATNLLYWSGLAAICKALRWPLLFRAFAVLAIGFYPPVFCIAAAIWKDSLMQAAFLAAVGCFIGFDSSGRRLLLGLALVFTALGVLVRHNGVAAAWPLLSLALLSSSFARRVPEPSRLVAVAATSIVACGAFLFITVKALSPFAEPGNIWQLTASFDLAGISLETGTLAFDEGSPALHRGAGLKQLRRRFNLIDSLTLFRCREHGCIPPVVTLEAPQDLAALARNWRRAILANPGAYLKHRYAVFREATGLSGRPAQIGFGSPNSPLANAYPLPHSARRWLTWFRSLRPTPWFCEWNYLVVGLAALIAGAVFYARTRSALPLAFASSAISYTLSFFFASGGADYRYSVWPILGVVLSCVHLAQSWAKQPASSAQPVVHP